MTKTELMETYTAEQLAEMVIELQNIPTAGKISCENSGNGDLIKVKCDKCGEEFLAFLDEKYILCKKTEFFEIQDVNEQLNKDVDELQSEAEKYRKAFKEAKQERDCQIAEYKKKIEKLTAENSELHCELQAVNAFQEGYPTEPIKVADMLINAEGEYEHNPITKALCGEDKGTYRIFNVSELRQIAEHLLVHCNHNGEMEE